MSSGVKIVSPFLQKLYTLTNAASQNFIEWDEAGRCFWTYDMGNFTSRVLPLYFKHNNYASFVRQLNMYGFHRTTDSSKRKIVPGVTMIERFSHPFFVRGREDLLVNIHRKTANTTKRAPSDSASIPDCDTSAGEMASATFSVQTQEYEERISALERQVQLLTMQNHTLSTKVALQQSTISQLLQQLAQKPTLLAMPDFQLPAMHAMHTVVKVEEEDRRRRAQAHALHTPTCELIPEPEFFSVVGEDHFPAVDLESALANLSKDHHQSIDLLPYM